MACRKMGCLGLEPVIEYIKENENIIACALLILPLNWNQETTQNSNYQKQIVLKINDTEELPEDTFTISLKLMQKYQQEEPSIIAKYIYGMYHKGYFCGGSNTDIKCITCNDKIAIPSKLTIYVLYWYHAYILHPGMDRT